MNVLECIKKFIKGSFFFLTLIQHGNQFLREKRPEYEVPVVRFNLLVKQRVRAKISHSLCAYI